MAAYWLGFWAFIAMAWVQSLVKELISYKLHSIAKKKKKNLIFKRIDYFLSFFAIWVNCLSLMDLGILVCQRGR